jgi:excinuclease ABC subunit A
MSKQQLSISKASVHNLKGVSCEIPHGVLCCFTGVSGSGKSSLAFDTIFVEGQRRYVQSLSHQAKRVVGNLPKPEVESISGLTPTIAIEQKTSRGSPRSTVGTLTEIYDYVRVLFARIATPCCPISGEPLIAISQQEMINGIFSRYSNRNSIILAPYVRKKKGELKEELQDLERRGYSRVRLDGSICRISDIGEVEPSAIHDLDVVIDRLKIHDENRQRIIESIKTALEIGKGLIALLDVETNEEELLSEHAYSKASGISYPPLEPNDFSFNTPSGMCPECQGLGECHEFILDRIIDEKKSIAEDCCSIAGSYQTVHYRNLYDNLSSLFHFSVDMPWKDLPQEARQILLYGTKQRWTRMVFINPNTGSTWVDNVQWRGILHEAKKKYHAAKSERYKRQMEEVMRLSICPECKGCRLKSYPAAAKLQGLTIQELTSKTIDEALPFFNNFALTQQQAFAEESIAQIKSRLAFLQKVGLGYLTLDRQTTTLSGGEFQRVRLASQMGSSLVGITYILDEPSIGLHPKDNDQLIRSLQDLKNQGNTVIVVEHDEQMMRSSDWMIDFGVGAGESGGEILYQGPVSGIETVINSLTSDYLFGRSQIPANEKKNHKNAHVLSLLGVNHRNIQSLDLHLPLEQFIAITGVSGSGKSSLIFETLFPALSNQLMKTDLTSGIFHTLKGHKHLDKVIHIDQAPIGRTPRSNPATYSGVFDDIRQLFASLPESKARGYTAGQFSFNVKQGVCPACSGMGVIAVDMDFLEQAWVECTVCEGRRFDNETLSIRYKGKSILDVLQMTCSQALELFSSIPSIKAELQTLCRVGLDYIQLGQSATTLSGGEAQRLKIAKELSRPSTGKTLYLLDEPTTGLHFRDVARLLDVLHELVSRGNTVVVIEHNMDLVKTADYVIDMGPGGGKAGGKIIASGTPVAMAQLKTPTGIALKNSLATASPPTPPKKLNKRKREVEEILVVGACQHTLKNISFSLPKNQLIALIGPSGAGKSSLAIETLFAEGQRQYVETLSPYARHYIKQMQRPAVEAIYGLPPTIAIKQREHASNPRSTVGTITEIYDYLRILWARLGIPHCPKTGSVVRSIDKGRAADIILSWKESGPVYILAPCLGATATSVPLQIEYFKKLGFSRFRLNGKMIDITEEDLPKLAAGRKASLDVVIDRLRPSNEEKLRLCTSIEEAARHGGNQLTILRKGEERVFNLSFAVEETGESYPEVTAQTFAFNTPDGMCPECHGLGINLSAFGLPTTMSHEQFMARLYWGSFQFDELSDSPESGWNEVFRDHLCPACEGTRLHPFARHVTIDSLSIAAFCNLPMSEARKWLVSSQACSSLEKPLQRVFDEIDNRLGLIDDLGLGYLSLNRSASTLSSGEAQRIRLTSQIGSHLSGLLYILDEPTSGLHPHDTLRLIKVLKDLKALGNTIAVIEHDPQLIACADHIVELGPEGGKEGGRIVFKEDRLTKASPTARAFAEPFIMNDGSALSSSSPSIVVRSASCHNLRNFSCTIPSNALVGIVGVSGSGKSTLLFDVLERAMQADLGKSKNENTRVSGLEEFERLVTIDQQPISQTTRSDVSTYLDLFTHLRQFFASLPEAKALGLDPSYFSTFHRHGMCKQCSGLGEKKVDMHFLSPVRVPCEMCHGLRLNPISLSIEYKGKNLGQILTCSIAETKTLFEGHWKICRYLDSLIDVGLHYLQLGAEMVSLSAGEIQRVRLAKELAKSRKTTTLYLMDEPTTGLHIQEVRNAVSQFQKLVKDGHTVIVVEHNIDLIAACDYLLELGPGAGLDGGKVIASGSPREIARRGKSPTGTFLRERMR